MDNVQRIKKSLFYRTAFSEAKDWLTEHGDTELARKMKARGIDNISYIVFWAAANKVLPEIDKVTKHSSHTILLLRYTVGGNPFFTLDEIAMIIGVKSRSTVHGIVNSAINSVCREIYRMEKR